MKVFQPNADNRKNNNLHKYLYRDVIIKIVLITKPKIPGVFWPSDHEFTLRIALSPFNFQKIKNVLKLRIKCINPGKGNADMQNLLIVYFYIFWNVSELRNGSPLFDFQKNIEGIRKTRKLYSLIKKYCALRITFHNILLCFYIRAVQFFPAFSLLNGAQI